MSMMSSRINVAQLRAPLVFCVVLMLGVGCTDSHDRSGDDAGRSLSDASTGDAAVPPADAARVDAGPRATCDAQDATQEICPDAICDGPDLWFWNGERCHQIDCGACVGADCGAGVFERDACESAHASCEPSLCRATGGAWFWWAQECGHYECGVAPEATCLIGAPVCDCGFNRSFEAGVGCVEDPSCPAPPPGGPDLSALCTGTGGTWGDLCCHSECGERCGDACLAPACDCGAGQIFDELRGCHDAVRCYERSAGQTCEAPDARCDGDQICCRSCGGAG